MMLDLLAWDVRILEKYDPAPFSGELILSIWITFTNYLIRIRFPVATELSR